MITIDQLAISIYHSAIAVVLVAFAGGLWIGIILAVGKVRRPA
jgi:hypothetical protein